MIDTMISLLPAFGKIALIWGPVALATVALVRIPAIRRFFDDVIE